MSESLVFLAFIDKDLYKLKVFNLCHSQRFMNFKKIHFNWVLLLKDIIALTLPHPILLGVLRSGDKVLRTHDTPLPLRHSSLVTAILWDPTWNTVVSCAHQRALQLNRYLVLTWSVVAFSPIKSIKLLPKACFKYLCLLVVYQVRRYCLSLITQRNTVQFYFLTALVFLCRIISLLQKAYDYSLYVSIVLRLIRNMISFTILRMVIILFVYYYVMWGILK